MHALAGNESIVLRPHIVSHESQLFAFLQLLLLFVFIRWLGRRLSRLARLPAVRRLLLVSACGALRTGPFVLQPNTQGQSLAVKALQRSIDRSVALCGWPFSAIMQRLTGPNERGRQLLQAGWRMLCAVFVLTAAATDSVLRCICSTRMIACINHTCTDRMRLVRRAVEAGGPLSSRQAPGRAHTRHPAGKAAAHLC